MTTARLKQFFSTIVLSVAAGPVLAVGHLQVEQPWIRAAPPGSATLAGYAVLRNDGDAPLVIRSVSSPDFRSASLHESVSLDGVAHMRTLDSMVIAPGGSLVLAPSGKHLMLMQPGRELASGATVTVHFVLKDTSPVDVDFSVREDAPPSR